MFDFSQEDALALLEEENGDYELTNDEKRKIIRRFAEECIQCFFVDKQCYYGGPIPNHVLYHDRNINMVIQTNCADGIDRVHQALGCFHKTSECAEKIINVLSQCGKRWIPKEFAAGLMIMYFRLCEGLVVE